MVHNTGGSLDTIGISNALPDKLRTLNLAAPGEPLAAFVERTYKQFFGAMVAARTSEQELSAWIDEVSLPEVLRERALRLNRSRGGRPPTKTRTLRAVEELVKFARAGRPGALDELRSIRALVATD